MKLEDAFSQFIVKNRNMDLKQNAKFLKRIPPSHMKNTLKDGAGLQ